MQIKTRIIKRNGEEVDFHKEKIVNAIKARMQRGTNIHQMNEYRSWRLQIILHRK